MIPLTLHEIATAVGARLLPSDAGDVLIDGPVSTDSREMGPGGLFVVRVGENADGMSYAGAAAGAGARAILADRPATGEGTDRLSTVLVDDVEQAFGRLARTIVDAATPPHGQVRCIAVTGSSGKTSTKDLLAHVLSQAGPTIAPVNSLNGEIGVPLTACRIERDTRFLVAEMGARGIGHLNYLTRIVPPDISVVLNVGNAHVGEFGSVESIAQAKGEIVEALTLDGIAILNADDPAVLAMRERCIGHVVTVGFAKNATVRAVDLVLDDLARPTFTAVMPEGHVRISLPLVGAHQVGNALAVVAVARELDLPLALVADAMRTAVPASRWRMEILTAEDGYTVINDAYNANPDSMAAALRALAAMQPGEGGHRIAVLGQMLELGDESATLHARTGDLARQLGIDVLVTIGQCAQAMDGDQWFADTTQAESWLRANARAADLVLLKSSRDAGLRWLGDRLAGLPGGGPR